MKIVIIGGGPAGLSAAIPLARNGVEVVILESGKFCGAQNLSGCVYFTNHLRQSDVLGDALEEAPWERKVTSRQKLIFDGATTLGIDYTNPSVYNDCYTVLRPNFDQWMADKAREFGVSVLTETTAKSLIYDDGRVIGVHTTEGAFYADGVFIAEGDAGELTNREEFETHLPSQSPNFVLGIKQVIETKADKINSLCQVDTPTDGVCRDISIDSANINSPDIPQGLNGFIYPNRESLSIGLYCPVSDQKQSSKPHVNELMKWFKSIPPVKNFITDGNVKVTGSKIIRLPDGPLPRLADHGVAIGGASTKLGQQYPFVNHTGPATASGRLFARAILDNKTSSARIFNRKQLQETYVKALKDTTYYQNANWNRPSTPDRSRAQFIACLRALGTTDNSSGLDNLHGIMSYYDNTVSPLELLERFFQSMAPPIPWSPDGCSLSRALLENQTTTASKDDKHRLKFIFSSNDKADFPDWFNGLKQAARPAVKQFLSILYNNDDRSISASWNQATKRLFQTLPRSQYISLWVRNLIYLMLSPWLILKSDSNQSTFPRTYESQRKKGLSISNTHKTTDQLQTDMGPEVSTSREKIMLFYGNYSFKSEQLDSSLPTRLHNLCPALVYELDSTSPHGVRTVVHSNRCINCGASQFVSESVEWSYLTRHRVTYPLTESGVSVNSGIQPQPDDVGLKNSRPNHSEFDDTLSIAPALLNRLEAQLRQWLKSFNERPIKLDPVAVRWLMTLARAIVTTFERFQDKLENSSWNPDQSFKTLIEDLDHVLNDILIAISDRRLLHARDLMNQALDHHLSHLKNSIHPPDKFKFPYQAFHRLERETDSIRTFLTTQNSVEPDDMSEEIIREFIRDTIDSFPRSEIFGTSIPELDKIEFCLMSSLDGSGQKDGKQASEVFKEFGQRDRSNDTIQQILRLSDHEEQLWQEAGFYNVLTDIIEQWRDWSRRYAQFGERQSSLQAQVRGQFLIALWLIRNAVNRVHACIVTGQNAEVKTACLRTLTDRIEKQKNNYDVIFDINSPFPEVVDSVSVDEEWTKRINDQLPVNDKTSSGLNVIPGRQNQITPCDPKASSRIEDCRRIVNKRIDSVNNLGEDHHSNSNPLSKKININILIMNAITTLLEEAQNNSPSYNLSFPSGLGLLTCRKLDSECHELINTEGIFIDNDMIFEPLHQEIINHLLTRTAPSLSTNNSFQVKDSLTPMFDSLIDKILKTRRVLGEPAWNNLFELKSVSGLIDLLAIYTASSAVVQTQDIIRQIYGQKDNNGGKIDGMILTILKDKFDYVEGEYEVTLDGLEHDIIPSKQIIDCRIREANDNNTT